MLDWSREWQIEFNVEKCKVTDIGGTNRDCLNHMDQKKLEVVEEEKDLGMLITNDLKASQQCALACNRANKVLLKMYISLNECMNE